ncbi:rubrerythrin family protein [Candidatus Latescibacterota bacterium]
MNKHLGQIIDESVQLELNVAELYKIFNKAFQEDAYFWRALSEEEENHANLIRKVVGLDFLTYEIIPEMLPAKLQEIREANENISFYIDEYKSNTPSREEAFNVALEFEDSACEIHYQEFMKKELDDMLTQTFQKLNKDDKDHFTRLRSYMKEHGIQILKES